MQLHHSSAFGLCPWQLVAAKSDQAPSTAARYNHGYHIMYAAGCLRSIGAAAGAMAMLHCTDTWSAAVPPGLGLAIQHVPAMSSRSELPIDNRSITNPILEEIQQPAAILLQFKLQGGGFQFCPWNHLLHDLPERLVVIHRAAILKPDEIGPSEGIDSTAVASLLIVSVCTLRQPFRGHGLFSTYTPRSVDCIELPFFSPAALLLQTGILNRL